MDNQTLLYVMTAFVVIAGLSLLLQLGMLIGLYRTSKAIEQKLETLVPKMEAVVPKIEALLPQVTALLGTSQTIIDQNRQQIVNIVSKTNDILDATKRQLVKVEEVLTDASARTKVQLEHAELVIDDTLSRAHETVAMVHNGVTRPLREIHGITAGLRTALAHLARGSRPTPDAATHDDEMFI
jgi:ABC-type transporter Mla subunit MlaD